MVENLQLKQPVSDFDKWLPESATDSRWKDIMKICDICIFPMISTMNYWRQCRDYGSHQCQRKNVFGLRLLQDRLPNRLDCENSLWTFHDAIPQSFDLGQMFAVPLNDPLAETSHHPTFSFNIPGFCIIIFDPSSDECWFFSSVATIG